MLNINPENIFKSALQVSPELKEPERDIMLRKGYLNLKN